jgi:non-specific serine/threonine protein kinase
LFGPTSRRWLDRLEADYPNLRSALAWYRDADPDKGIRLAGSLWKFWDRMGNYGGPWDGQRWLETFLARVPVGSLSRGKALLGAGFGGRWLSTLGQSRSWAEQSLAIARAAENEELAAWALHLLGTIETMQREYVSSWAHLEESVAVGRRAADDVIAGMSLRELGHLARIQGDYERAAALYADGLSITRRVGDPWNIAWMLMGVGHLARRQQDIAHARETLQACRAVARDAREYLALAQAARALGALERSVGNFDAAESYFKEALTEAKLRGWIEYTPFWLFPYATFVLQRGSYARGVRLAAVASRMEPDQVSILPSDRADHAAAIEAARTAMGEPAFAAAWAEGQAMTLDEALANALGDDDR